MEFREKIIRFIITLLILILGNREDLAQTSPQKLNGKVTFVNSVPMPLGRYVQLANSSAVFTIQQYLASKEPSLQISFNMKFKIIRHVPQLELSSFHAESMGENSFYIKFKKDQNAIELLSNAIADSQISEITVPWSSIGKADIKNRYQRTNKQTIKFTDSSIYRRVPKSNVKLVGFDSNNIILTSPADVKIYSKDGLSRLYFTIDVNYLNKSRKNNEGAVIFPDYAIVSTTNNSFETVLKAAEVQGTDMFWFKNVDILPHDMDTLLTDDILITVYARKVKSEDK